jgi:hypothetical protein
MRIDLPVRLSLCGYCRDLVAGGADPLEPVHVYRGGTLCFDPMPLRRWAAMTTEEGAARSIRFRRWRQTTPESGACAPSGGKSGGAA